MYLNRSQTHTSLFSRLLVIAIVVCTILFSGCKEVEKGKPLSEGIIEYAIEYPNIDSNNVLVKFMPDEMTMTFKDNKYKHEWVAGLGLFKTGYVADCNEKQMDYILKLINVKYKSRFDAQGADELNKHFPEHEVKETGETKEIAGYTCHEADVIFNNPDFPDFKVYYTTHLKLKDPNWCNPLKKINGVLLEYELTKYDLTMKFIAQNVVEAVVEESDFQIPKDFQEISNKRMEFKIKETFISFQE